MSTLKDLYQSLKEQGKSKEEIYLELLHRGYSLHEIQALESAEGDTKLKTQRFHKFLYVAGAGILLAGILTLTKTIWPDLSRLQKVLFITGLYIVFYGFSWWTKSKGAQKVYFAFYLGANITLGALFYWSFPFIYPFLQEALYPSFMLSVVGAGFLVSGLILPERRGIYLGLIMLVASQFLLVGTSLPFIMYKPLLIIVGLLNIAVSLVALVKLSSDPILSKVIIFALTLLVYFYKDIFFQFPNYIEFFLSVLLVLIFTWLSWRYNSSLFLFFSEVFALNGWYRYLWNIELDYPDLLIAGGFFFMLLTFFHLSLLFFSKKRKSVLVFLLLPVLFFFFFSFGWYKELVRGYFIKEGGSVFWIWGFILLSSLFSGALVLYRKRNIVARLFYLGFSAPSLLIFLLLPLFNTPFHSLNSTDAFLIDIWVFVVLLLGLVLLSFQAILAKNIWLFYLSSFLFFVAIVKEYFAWADEYVPFGLFAIILGILFLLFAFAIERKKKDIFYLVEQKFSLLEDEK